MDINELNQLLEIKDGVLSLDAKTFPGDLLGSLLIEYNNNAPIVIDKATKDVGVSSVTVTGASSFLKVSNSRVTAVFGLDSDQQPTAAITYALIGSVRNSGYWTFGQSFPNLPSFGTSYLDALLLTSASYVLCTHDGLKSATGETLARGLNFFSNVAPEGIAGIFNSLLDEQSSLRMSGTINLPISGQVSQFVPYRTFPWQASPPIPGISLKVPLGIKINLSNNLILDDTNLIIYTPTSQKWFEQNNTYWPVIILSGSLTIPTLNVSVDMHAYVESQSDTTTIVGTFEDVSFSKLSDLSVLTNGGGIKDCLPHEIQSQLDKLILEQFSLALYKTPGQAGIQYLSVTVGMPNTTWPVIDDFTITDIVGTFVVTSPFDTSRKVEVLLSGTLNISDAKFDVKVQVPDFSIYAQLERDATIPLSSFFKTYLTSLPAPPDLAVNGMSFTAVPGSNEYDFFVDLADDPAWTLDVTPVPLTISNVRLDVSKRANTTTGMFTGSLAIGDFVDLTATYQMPGDFIVRSDIPSIQLSKLIGLVSNIGLSLPSDFDLSFTDNYIIIQKSNGQLTLSCGTNVENFGLLVLTAQKQGLNWGFVFGMDVQTVSLGSLPCLDMLGKFVDFVGLEKILLVASSISDSSFNFPDTIAFNQPSLGNKNITLPVQAEGLVAGLNVYAQLSEIKSKGMNALANFFGIKADGTIGITVSISLPDPNNNSKLYLSISTKPYSNTMIAGEFGVLMQGEDIAVFLTARLDTTLQDHSLIFAVTALIVQNGAFISGSLQGSAPKFSLIDDVSVQLSNMAVEIGIDLEGIPSFGLTAQIDTSKGFDSSIAVFFDSDNPAKSLLAGAISNLSLNDIVQTFSKNVDDEIPAWLVEAMKDIKITGLNAFSIPFSYSDALNQLDLAKLAEAFSAHNITVPTNIQQTLLVVNSPGKIWSLTLTSNQSAITHYQLRTRTSGDQIDVTIEAQLYLAPESTKIGNINFPQGFKVQGTEQFFFLKLTSDTEILPSKGIKINEELDEIHWKVGALDLLKISGADGTGNAKLSLCTYTDNNQTDPNLIPPHLLISGSIVFLDAVSINAYINIDASGFHFKLDYANFYFLVKGQFTGQFTKLDDFGASGTASCTVGDLNLGKAGTIHLDTDVSASLGISVTDNNGLAVIAKANLDVKVFDDSFSIIDANIIVDENFFKNLQTSLVKLIVDEILKEPLTWLNWVKNELIAVVEDVATLLKDVFGLTWQEAARLMQEAGYAFEEIASKIANAFDVAVEYVGNFLASLAKVCAIDSVNALTESSGNASLHSIAHPALAKLTTSKDGQRLLYLFYANQNALTNALLATPSVWQDYVGTNGSLRDLKDDPATKTIRALESLHPITETELETAINKAITILKPYTGLSATEFLRRLEDRR